MMFLSTLAGWMRVVFDAALPVDLPQVDQRMLDYVLPVDRGSALALCKAKYTQSNLAYKSPILDFRT